MTTTDYIAAYGAILSTITALAGGIWVIVGWRDKKRERRKVSVHMQRLSVNNRQDGKVFHMLPVRVANLGREPVIVHQLIARGPGHSSHSGHYREPAAAYGINEPMFPKRLEPGGSEEFCSFSIGIFRNQIDEVVVLDSDNNEFPVPLHDLERAREWALKKLEELNISLQPMPQK